jgi:hypothetical protein
LIEFFWAPFLSGIRAMRGVGSESQWVL